MPNKVNSLDEYLSCPNCKGKLIIKKQINCSKCKLFFSYKNDIIDLLPKKLTEQNLTEIKRFNKRIAKLKTNFYINHCSVVNFNDNIKPLIKSKKYSILDIGSGPVVIGRLFKKINKKNLVFACDFSKERLEDVKLFDDFEKVDYKIRGSIEKLPFQNE